jgi:hypothetical protein
MIRWFDHVETMDRILTKEIYEADLKGNAKRTFLDQIEQVLKGQVKSTQI